MSAIRISRLRAARPQLSLRYQCLQRRFESSTTSSASTTPAPTATTTTTAAPAPSTTVPPPPPPPPPVSRSFLRAYRALLICSTISLALGLYGGSFVTAMLAPPPPPPAGSPEDAILTADLSARIDHEFKVSVLRGKCLGVARQLKGEEGRWVEIVPAAEADRQKVVGGPLISAIQGAPGLGVERIFWDQGEKQLVAVVWFGRTLSGWPGVVHGGLLATALNEKLALAAQLAQGRSAAATSAATPQRLPGTGDHAKMVAPPVAAALATPTELSLSYVKPTYADRFHVIRISPALFDEREVEMIRQPFTSGEGYNATIETLDGRVCVKAQAKFAPSSKIEQVEQEIVQSAKDKYVTFKQWLWPSRQQNSQI